MTFHECDAEDWNSFYPPAKRSKDIIDHIREDPDRTLYCIDEGYDMAIYGQFPVDLRTFTINFVPCNMVPSWDVDPKPVSDECIANLEA